MLKYIAIAVLLIILGGGGYFMYTQNGQTKGEVAYPILPGSDGTVDEWGVDPRCKKWYGGCNTCTRGSVLEGKRTYTCTTMVCATPGEPSCVEYF